MAPKDLGIVSKPEGARIAFLLIHGFSAAPDEVATLGTFLEEHGIASLAVRVAGHNTTPEDLSRTTKEDIYESVRAGLEEVKSWKPDSLFIAGLSMGGALTLLLAARESGIDGIVVMSPAVYLESPMARLVPLLKHFMKYRNADLSSMATMYDVMRTKYDREPLSAIHELLKLSREARKEMVKITISALVIQSGDDKTVDPDNGKIVFDSISSEDKTLHILEGAEHVLTCHPTRTEAYAMILEFIERVSS